VRTRYLKIKIFTLVGCFLLLTASCTLVQDTGSKTDGYKVFSGTLNNIAVSFEYPDDWQRQSVETYAGESYVDLKQGSLTIHFGVVRQSVEFYESPEDLIQHYLDRLQPKPEFQLLSREVTSLGSNDALELLASYRLRLFDVHAPPESADIDKLVAERVIATEYKENVVSLFFLIDLTQLEVVQPVFDRIVETFKFGK
jgi:hypothetical protein